MSLSNPWKIVKDRQARQVAVHKVTKSQAQVSKWTIATTLSVSISLITNEFWVTFHIFIDRVVIPLIYELLSHIFFLLFVGLPIWSLLVWRSYSHSGYNFLIRYKHWKYYLPLCEFTLLMLAFCEQNFLILDCCSFSNFSLKVSVLLCF